ncbi:WecB/TagA/CpsF family glycosyltransferase [Parerythrobacter aestuarii]|uniref:WecB/TagA/CpsF family glycosyltransferase n=1 Tax=Parerythrobacter aestuarii TaxID=3020909 RepID=UPI0024DE7E06|nr:WecB/TagA/CpsF family glycosyltransferase [Parerythrobacter aestuarii]
MTAALDGNRSCAMMACLNPHSFVVAEQDEQFRAALKSAEWLLPDGAGIVWAARRLGDKTVSRITGPDTFLAVMERLDAKSGSVFFLGSSEAVLAKVRDQVALHYPNVTVAGTYSPPFKAEFTQDDNQAMIDAINAAKPDVLWVGMTAPKQEKWLARHSHDLNVGAAGAIGAAFDFFAGTVKRSPPIFRSLGLEWLPRLVQQPRRLWRRIFVSGPIFAAAVYRERQTRRKT